MYLGLDIGTSGVKGVLIDDTSRLVASRNSALEVLRPETGWAEQNPQDWIAACRTVIHELRLTHKHAFSGLKAIGLSGQMHGAVLLDDGDEPLRPCILWNDSRSHAECAELEAMAPFREIGGNIVMPGFTAPKLLWVAKNEPDIFAQVRRVLLPKDYVRLWLTGEHVAEMSDAAGTLWLDVARRRWSEELLGATGLSEGAMPRLVEGTEQSGSLREELAVEWGVEQLPVAGGGGDNAATACGMGVLHPGIGFLSLGTSGVLFAACDTFRPNTSQAVHTFCHAAPGIWHHMGVTLAAVDSLTWLGRVTGHPAPRLTALLPDRITRPSPVLFLPYLSGERTPYNFPWSAGTFANLSMSVELPDLVQAVLEGVGFAISDCKNALESAGTRIEQAYVVGGGARSPQWLEILANITGIQLLVPDTGDYGAAFGAAKLAMACLGEKPLDDVMTAPPVKDVISASNSLKTAYSETYGNYSLLFKGVRPVSEQSR